MKRMNTTLRLLGIILLSFLYTTQVHAQATTFIPDVNYAYLDKLIATAKKNYPEIKVRQSQVNFARNNYNGSKLSWLDVFTASYIYQPKNSQNLLQPTIFNGYQLSVSINIGQILTRPSQIHAAHENYNIARYQQSEYMLTLEAQVKRFYFAYLAGQAEVRLRSGATIDAEASVKQLKYSFQKNETTFQVYNEALTNLYNQNGFQVQAELAMLTAKANLEEFLGAKLEDVK
ncbi:TolC family protein [Mucilaginibacter sp. ZB1P21]|uniref:TolC family protein n=1 Tax=Mucilaginibacter glaciei TaxID=2772109 RepID=A0A926NQ68_9SPHI|nr:TolC family protein [Mucilaginibacter glaciei]MBD1391860.1 TolC family protein [Mucilaginibacter glaciei]